LDEKLVLMERAHEKLEVAKHLLGAKEYKPFVIWW
jgi:hypothetical protein